MEISVSDISSAVSSFLGGRGVQFGCLLWRVMQFGFFQGFYAGYILSLIHI